MWVRGVADLQKLHGDLKYLSGRPIWVEKDPRNLLLVSPLEIDEITYPGLQLRITTLKPEPDRDVTFQLEYHPPVGKAHHLVRLDWRPFHRHNNRNIGPTHLRLIEFGGTHIHPFDLNWSEQKQAMIKQNLPIALPVDPKEDPGTFEELLEFAAVLLKISDLMSMVPRPPWQQSFI